MAASNSIQQARSQERDESDLKKLALSKDVDIGAAYANALDGSGAYTQAEERALRWKLDRRIIVIMWLLNTLKAVDKVTTSTGVSYGMKQSTGLTGDKYSWVGSSFYFGYLIWCFPAAAFLQKLPIAKFISTGVGLWGIVLIGTGFSNNFPTLVALRVLLGALEAPVLPGTFLMMNMCIPNGGLTNFSPLIIHGLGYSSQNSTLIMMPTGIVQTAASWIMSGVVFWAAGKYPKKNIRCIVMICGQIVGMISAVFLYTLPLDALKSRLAALYMSYFYIGAYALSLGLNATNTVGHTKKVTFGALIFITYCLSNIVAPQFFKTEQAPLYPLGIAAILGSYILSLITISLYAAYCAYENRRRDMVDDAIGERIHLDTDFMDLTDRQNVHFRYAW
ncbi:MFS general substrate transporter [Cadophora sp. DSE1049]|nr:MFS general substrate transporter [Cadophora sp. DSE1049]